MKNIALRVIILWIVLYTLVGLTAALSGCADMSAARERDARREASAILRTLQKARSLDHEIAQTAALIERVLYEGTTVQGQLYRVGPDGRPYGAPSLMVTVWNERIGRSPAAYSDGNGMYYLYRIPPGAYTVEVWLTPDPRSRLFRNIQFGPVPFFNVDPPIRVP